MRGMISGERFFCQNGLKSTGNTLCITEHFRAGYNEKGPSIIVPQCYSVTVNSNPPHCAGLFFDDCTLEHINCLCKAFVLAHKRIFMLNADSIVVTDHTEI